MEMKQKNRIGQPLDKSIKLIAQNEAMKTKKTTSKEVVLNKNKLKGSIDE